MIAQSLLQRHRLQYQPTLPLLLHDLASLHPVKSEGHTPVSDPKILSLFPHTNQHPLLRFEKGDPSSTRSLKVGVVLSGGQAPGGHNVISGLFDALKKLHSGAQLIGFLEGLTGLIHNQSIVLDAGKIAPYRNQGGFDLIGSSRTKIETPEQFAAVAHTLKTQELDGLVIIGGDDSNTTAAFLAEYCLKQGLKTCVVGVPKTIDGDLRNAFIEMSFGFDTACKIYSEMIGNLLKDSLSAKKYYFFVKLMGRSASHVTLECALQTQVNLAIISEEVAACKQTLADLVGQIADLICERAEQGKNYGVILIPEGLLEFIPDFQKLSQASLGWPEEIQKQLMLERDPHGNLQVSKIETERLLIALVEQELMRRKEQGYYAGKFNPQPLFYGYEGRSGLPSNFDSQYCYALGHVAALLIHHKASGYLCCLSHLSQPVETWEVRGVPLVSLLHTEMRKNKEQVVIQKFLVDLEGPVFKQFEQKRAQWRLNDLYCCPGPIQFEGPSELTDQPPLTVQHEKIREKS